MRPTRTPCPCVSAHACGTNGEFLTAGLQGTGETSIDEGNVDFQTSDETDRSFDVHVMCSTPTNAFAIEIRNKDQVLVDREVIRCVGDPVVTHLADRLLQRCWSAGPGPHPQRPGHRAADFPEVGPGLGDLL